MKKRWIAVLLCAALLAIDVQTQSTISNELCTQGNNKCMHVQFCYTKTVQQTESHTNHDGQQQRQDQWQWFCDLRIHTGCVCNTLQ